MLDSHNRIREVTPVEFHLLVSDPVAFKVVAIIAFILISRR